MGRQMKQAVMCDTAQKRNCESSWKIHRIHWEKNLFIFDLMYRRKIMSKNMFEWLIKENMADRTLIEKWRRPGFNTICSLMAIQKSSHNYRTTSHCRVPIAQRPPQLAITPNVKTGCISCYAGHCKNEGPLWWNTKRKKEACNKLVFL